MSGNVLDRYLVKAPQTAKPSEVAEPIEDVGPFAVLRGFDRALMLELRMKDGSSTAFSYTYLVKAAFDPSDGLTLQFGASQVHIVGTNLAAEVRPNVQLFQSLIRHRLVWIQEMDAAARLIHAPDSITIDSISIS